MHGGCGYAGAILTVVLTACSGSSAPEVARPAPQLPIPGPPTTTAAPAQPAPPAVPTATSEPSAAPAAATASSPPPVAASSPPPSEPPASGPRALPPGQRWVYAPKDLVRIYHTPSRDAPVVGAMRAGQATVVTDASMTLERQQERLAGCSDGWYPVAPRGFVCVGGADHATFDANDPRVLGARAVLPDLTSDYPFKFGTSSGSPQYLRIPTEEEQRQAEPDLHIHLANLPVANEKNGAVDTTPAGHGPSDALLKYLAYSQPPLLSEREAYDGYKIAWAQELDANGRTWLLTPDMTFIAKDRVRQKPGPTLRGIDLKKTPMQLPLAFFWLGDSTKFEVGPDGKLKPTQESWKRHEFVEATMEQARGPGGIYWKLRSGRYVKYQDVAILRKADARPSGIGPADKWIEVRITWGYAMAYEGDRPVYVAAMSPGVAGIQASGLATARGRQHVDWKMYSGDMSGRDRGKDWFVDEVPWVQYYKGNYALHGAWWHNDFGRPKSHGCVNLAPADARFLFEWMEPTVPEGWYAVSTLYPQVQGTVIMLRP